MTLDDLKHAQRERLIYLDRCLTWRGVANRRDLIDRFGISVAQAAIDFRTYLTLAGDTPPIYDAVRKTYVAAEGHRPLVPSSATDAFDILRHEHDDGGAASLPLPVRRADPNITGHLYRAMHSGRALHIRYTSMSTGIDDGQWIAPSRFTCDGESVHLRAYSFKHQDYRDYLPIRVSANSSFETRALGEPLPHDVDWHTLARIWLQPKSNLTPEQADVVRLEYGFDGNLLLIELRKAMEFYLMHRWRLNDPGARLEVADKEYSPVL